jgi:hypothetical protein
MVGQNQLRRVTEKLEAIRTAAEHEFPTGDIDTMLAEIERGYLSGQPTPFSSTPSAF